MTGAFVLSLKDDGSSSYSIAVTPMSIVADRIQPAGLADRDFDLPSSAILDKFLSYLEANPGVVAAAKKSFGDWENSVAGVKACSDSLLPGLELLKDVPVVPDAPARLRSVAAIVHKQPSCLQMRAWHTCETVHCIAGWAMHLAGDHHVIRLDELFAWRYSLIGAVLLGHEAACYFFDVEDDSQARAFLERQLYPV